MEEIDYPDIPVSQWFYLLPIKNIKVQKNGEIGVSFKNIFTHIFKLLVKIQLNKFLYLVVGTWSAPYLPKSQE